jgi:trimethylamine:corrinoid methyltransferase-like protein
MPLSLLMKTEQEEIRRAILNVLYESGSALRAKRVRVIMSELGCSVFWSEFVKHVEYLVGEELIRVFPAGSQVELSAVEQAKYLEQCKRLRFDAPECDTVMVRIRQRGRQFIEGNANDVKGVARD